MANADTLAPSLALPITHADAIPVSISAQFRRNIFLYVSGALLLLGQQVFMAMRDFKVKEAVNAAVDRQPDAGARAAIFMLAISVGAALMRVLSRITIFTGGRNVEYELRAALLARLHKLGPAFFRKMPTGEIMSRSTNDLTQVRLLLGFGILNVTSAAFSLASALYVMLSISPRLSAATLAMVPVLVLVTRYVSTRLYRYNRDNQETLGKMSDRVLASLAGVRVVRSFALEEAESTAFDDANRAYLVKNLDLARLRGSMGPMMGWIISLGVLILFVYGGRLILAKDIGPGEFIAFWMAMQRLV